jgi:hypothetical protein
MENPPGNVQLPEPRVRYKGVLNCASGPSRFFHYSYGAAFTS